MNSEPQSIIEHLLQAAFRYVETGCTEALRELLITNKAVARARSTTDHTGAIHKAAQAGNVAMLALLIDAGADPNMPEGERVDEGDVPEYLPGDTPLHHATRSDHLEAVQFLLAKGANASARDHVGSTPLHNTHSMPIAQSLLRAGANPNVDCWLKHYSDTFGWASVATPLHIAARWGNAPLIQLLVDHGARIDPTEGMLGRTPLHCAAMCGQQAATDLLLSLGADPNAMCEIYGYGVVDRMTPLHYAARHGHLGVAKSLVKAGAELHPPGGELGTTAAELASEENHHEVAEFLRSVVKDSPPMLFGVCECIGFDGVAALKAVKQGEHLETLVARSHLDVSIRRCGSCSQLFVDVFVEKMSFDGGDDSQANLYVPIDRTEADRLRAQDASIILDYLVTLSGERRYLVEDDYPAGQPIRDWRSGPLVIPPHF